MKPRYVFIYPLSRLELWGARLVLLGIIAWGVAAFLSIV